MLAAKLWEDEEPHHSVFTMSTILLTASEVVRLPALEHKLEAASASFVGLPIILAWLKSQCMKLQRFGSMYTL
ncbi:hypothetical protein M0R45_007871 [Rubus argutus]|uniref:Uncharacterized protein n=1 Tax=Rubus argutus TaxID=59490 RepID=A0AAW1XZI3_RUBAR